MGAKANGRLPGDLDNLPLAHTGANLRDADRRTIATRGRTWASAKLVASSTVGAADGEAIRGAVEADLGQLAERTEPFHTWFLIHPTLLKSCDAALLARRKYGRHGRFVLQQFLAVPEFITPHRQPPASTTLDSVQTTFQHRYVTGATIQSAM